LSREEENLRSQVGGTTHKTEREHEAREREEEADVVTYASKEVKKKLSKRDVFLSALRVAVLVQTKDSQ